MKTEFGESRERKKRVLTSKYCNYRLSNIIRAEYYKLKGLDPNCYKVVYSNTDDTEYLKIDIDDVDNSHEVYFHLTNNNIIEIIDEDRCDPLLHFAIEKLVAKGLIRDELRIIEVPYLTEVEILRDEDDQEVIVDKRFA